MTDEKLTKLLETPYSLIYWDEPREGLNRKGEPCTTHVAIRATVDDCIEMQRHINKQAGRSDQSDKDLLDDFVIVNWAYTIPEEP